MTPEERDEQEIRQAREREQRERDSGDRYADYKEMDQYPEMQGGLYADDARIVWREDTDAEVKAVVEKMLDRLSLKGSFGRLREALRWKDEAGQFREVKP